MGLAVGVAALLVVAGADTVRTTARGDPRPVPVDATVLWRSADLERPRALARVGTTLVGADRDRLHFVPLEGGEAWSVGRPGEGPGEYRSIGTVGVAPGDTVVVWDGRARRLSYLDARGTFVRSVPAAPDGGFPNVAAGGEPLRVGPDGTFAWVGTELVRPDRRTRVALLLQDPAAGASRVVATWPHVAWRDFGGIFAPTSAYDHGTLVALGPGGRVAWGRGGTYCVHVQAASSPDPVEVCREHRPVRPGRGLRRPDLSVVEDARLREALERVVTEQAMPAALPAFDRLLFGEDGRLWVRGLDPELAELHPNVLAARPDLGPARRRWDVLAPGWTVAASWGVTASFDLRMVEGGMGYGFLTLPSGEVAVGRVAFR